MILRSIRRCAPYLHFAAVLVAACTAALAAPPAATPAPQPSLYQRLGGYDAVAAVCDDFIPRLVTDPQLGRFFVGLSKDSGARIRQHLVDLVCNATGGPCLYLGRDMKTSHAGLGITASDWNVGVARLKDTLAKFRVPQREQDELIGVVATLQKDIVEKP